VTPVGAIFVGLIAGVVCALAVGLKYKLGYDDSLDVVGVHLVGGIVGSLMVGLFADTAVNSLGADGLFLGGGGTLLGKQALAVGATLVWSFVISFILAKVIDVTIGFRVSEEHEAIGLDLSQHAEHAYSLGDLGSMGRTG